MRKMLLTTVSALALGLGGVAAAQESTETGETTDQIQTEELNVETGTDSELGADTGLESETDLGTGTDLGATGSGSDMGASAFSGYSADELIGTSVQGVDGDDIAEVSDLVLDDSDQVSHVLVDVGGFLGIGSKVVALDPNAIQISQDDAGEPVITTSMTQEELESMPSFENDGSYRLQSQMGTDMDATTDTGTTTTTTE